MFTPSIYEEKQMLQVKLPWHKNTARGFAIAAPTVLLLIFFVGFCEDTKVDDVKLRSRSVPVEILNFGDGDGTGMRKGNLTEEGAAHKGSLPQSQLSDAEISTNTAKSNAATTDITQSSNLVPKNEVSGDTKNTDLGGNSSRNVGSPDGATNGTGLGSRGMGAGKGLGFGEIDWGGGGNRVVIYKKVPVFPPGVNTSGVIKIKFTVKPDGTVTTMIPLQKADPRLERAALDALRQWRFNKLNDNREMVGIIPFTFKLR